ncbi:MAG TPA: imidazolonepropionase, partial [Bacteroidales bacterium]|nr:imidazolonepropionase [Bacteroidales bacterium]
MAILITNIKELVQVEEQPVTRVAGAAMAEIKTLTNAWLYIEQGRIRDFGTMPCDELRLMKESASDQQNSSSPKMQDDLSRIDATGRMVFPSFCDAHTHLVYAGSREKEYIDKIRGLSYEEIARRGGGILNSARRLHEATEEELTEQASARLQEIMMTGTGAVEIKSGYG